MWLWHRSMCIWQGFMWFLLWHVNFVWISEFGKHGASLDMSLHVLHVPSPCTFWHGSMWFSHGPLGSLWLLHGSMWIFLYSMWIFTWRSKLHVTYDMGSCEIDQNPCEFDMEPMAPCEIDVIFHMELTWSIWSLSEKFGHRLHIYQTQHLSPS